jgi:hypothetical protein
MVSASSKTMSELNLQLLSVVHNAFYCAQTKEPCPSVGRTHLNVIPKKRTHQFVQWLTVLRNLALKIPSLALKIPHLVQKIPRLGVKIPNLSVNPPFTRVLNYRVIWFSASLFTYGWFLTWIAYDVFVWHKSITQVSLTKFAGAFAAMAMIWAGTFIFKAPKPVVVEQSKRQKTLKERIPRKRKHQTSKLASSAPSQAEQIPQIHTEPEPEPQPERKPIHKQPRETAATSARCSHRIVNSLEIPDGCLTCTDLLQCLSKTGK